MGAFTVERSTTIDAPAEVVYELIDDFHEWRQWSPWEGVDPEMRREYSGPDSGPGASYSWHGNRKAGAGRMTIQRANPPKAVEIDLDFERPFAAHNQVRFSIEQQPAAALVTWTMSGVSTGIAGLIGKIVPMDRFLGRDFERGLAALKAAAEKAAGTA